MKAFTQKESFSMRFNLVDENNVILGYDMYQDCCEHATIEIKRDDVVIALIEDCEIQNDITIDELNEIIKEYVFSVDKYRTYECNISETSTATFMAYDKDDNHIDIVLSNCHNGYYAHEFNFTDSNGKVIIEDYL